jgi:hypothetical protein
MADGNGLAQSRTDGNGLAIRIQFVVLSFDFAL